MARSRLRSSVSRSLPTVRSRTGADKLELRQPLPGAAVQMAYLRDYEGANARRVINFAGVVSGPPAGALGGLLRFGPGRGGNSVRCHPGRPATYRIVNYPNVQYVNIASNTDGSYGRRRCPSKPAPNVRNVCWCSRIAGDDGRARRHVEEPDGPSDHHEQARSGDGTAGALRSERPVLGPSKPNLGGRWEVGVLGDWASSLRTLALSALSSGTTRGG